MEKGFHQYFITCYKFKCTIKAIKIIAHVKRETGSLMRKEQITRMS